jgi:tetratricopeptide (TPR) repeat protein
MAKISCLTLRSSPFPQINLMWLTRGWQMIDIRMLLDVHACQMQKENPVIRFPKRVVGVDAGCDCPRIRLTLRCLVLAVIVFLIPAKSLRTHAEQFVEAEFAQALEQIADARNVTFTTINIKEVETWAVAFPNGVIAAGRVVRFDSKKESRETLAESLRYQEIHARFLRSKQQTCDAIAGQINGLQGQIERQVSHLRSAAQAGFQGSTAIINQLQAEQRVLQGALQSERGHHRNMLDDHQRITGPVSHRYKQLVENYAKAAAILERATLPELRAACSLLEPKASKDGGYAEAVLLAYATIRGKLDASRVGELIAKAGTTLSSSESLGFSPINMNRITLSIRCDTGEDLDKTMKYVKNAREVTKSPAALYALAAWYESKEVWGEAARYFRMARAKIKSDPINRAIATSDLLYCQWRHGKLDSVDGVEEFIEDIEAVPQSSDPDEPSDWQVYRGLAVISLLKGDHQAATLHANKAMASAPPRIKKDLADLEAVFRGERGLEVGGRLSLFVEALAAAGDLHAGKRSAQLFFRPRLIRESPCPQGSRPLDPMDQSFQERPSVHIDAGTTIGPRGWLSPARTC